MRWFHRHVLKHEIKSHTHYIKMLGNWWPKGTYYLCSCGERWQTK